MSENDSCDVFIVNPAVYQSDPCAMNNHLRVVALRRHVYHELIRPGIGKVRAVPTLRSLLVYEYKTHIRGAIDRRVLVSKIPG